MFSPLLALNYLYKHLHYVKLYRQRRSHYSKLAIKNKTPLVRKHLYFIEFTEAISIILKTRYDILHIHWGIGGNTRKTRLRLRSLKQKERAAIKMLQYPPVTKLGKKQHKALSKKKRHVLIVLNSQKAYYHKAQNSIIVEF